MVTHLSLQRRNKESSAIQSPRLIGDCQVLWVRERGKGGRNTGVMYTGLTEDVSDEYSRIAEQRAPKPHGMLRDTNNHIDLVGTSSPTGLHTMRSLMQLGTNDKGMELDSNNMGTNRINTISTSSTIDNYTQLAPFRDKGRHSNISNNPDNTGKYMMININTKGIGITLSRWIVQVLIVGILISLVDIILGIIS
jgi:hypothetical protein